MTYDPVYVSLVTALAKLASSAEAQRASDFPPEELRLEWDDAFVFVQNPAVGWKPSGASLEMKAMRAFNEYLWSLPAKPDPMWHRENLDKQPWPTIRARASDLLAFLSQSYAS
jgi:hypothetical protein